MTGQDSIDLDLLADYLAGALAGTPEEGRVASLVAGDPEWTAAHAALGAASARVTAGLAAMGGVQPPMPPEMAARLDAALGTASLTTALPAQPDRHSATDRQGGSDRHSATDQRGPADRRGPDRRGPADQRGPADRHSGRDRHRAPATVIRLPLRRRPRLALSLAVAASVLGVASVGVGVAVFRPAPGSRSGTSMSGRVAAPDRMAPTNQVAVTASGTDYDTHNLAAAAGRVEAPGFTAGAGPADTRNAAGSAPLNGAPVPSTPVELARLRDPAALKVCLGAVAGHYGGQPLLVDYARFAGRPALIVVLVSGGSPPDRRVVAVGPQCGTPPDQPDEIAETPA